MQRYGSVIKLKPEKLAEYKELHASVWPDVLRMIHDCSIRNYSIYYRELAPGEHYLFSYVEYVGQNFEADMAAMAADSPSATFWAAFAWPSTVPFT